MLTGRLDITLQQPPTCPKPDEACEMVNHNADATDEVDLKRFTDGRHDSADEIARGC